MHKIGICHRDLKPENMLLDYKKDLKIIDFGLSNLYKKNEKLKTACGSPGYAAPEMIKGEEYNGLLSDLWSIGIILYVMIIGCLPFDDPNENALYEKIIAGKFSIPKHVSPLASDLIRKILVCDPNKRISIKGSNAGIYNQLIITRATGDEINLADGILGNFNGATSPITIRIYDCSEQDLKTIENNYNVKVIEYCTMSHSGRRYHKSAIKMLKKLIGKGSII